MQQQRLLWTIGRPPPPSPLHPCVGVSSWRRRTPSCDNTRVRVRVRLCSSPSISSKNATIGAEILPNALRRRKDPSWSGGGFSLGIDLGASRTGLAIGKGYTPPRPLAVILLVVSGSPFLGLSLCSSSGQVLELRGQKLELRLLDIAQQQEVDEFIIGLPRSHDGKETPQSNKVRSIAGRLAVRAAERGWKVYLQDEHGTSLDALDFMIDMGLKKSARQEKIDAYSAIMVLERYFSMSGDRAELVLPKQLGLQEKLLKGPYQDLDF